MRNSSGMTELIMKNLIIFPLAFILAHAHRDIFEHGKLVGDRGNVHLRNVFGIKELIMTNLIIFPLAFI